MAKKHLLQEEAPTSLKELISRDFRGEVKHNPVTDTFWVRASSLAGMCPRAEVLLSLNELPRVNTFGSDTDSRLIALHGTALHWGMQNRLLRDYLVGKWLCKSCGSFIGGYKRQEVDKLKFFWSTPTEDIGPHLREQFDKIMKKGISQLVEMPSQCPLCMARNRDEDDAAFEYVEQWYGDLDMRAGGHPDGFLRVPYRKDLGIFEGKSIASHKAYVVRHTPMLDHVVQIHLYMMITGLRWGVILYWDKGMNGIRGLHEHEIEYDPSLAGEIRRTIGQFWEGHRSRKPPPRELCDHSFCERAQECPVKKLCFEDEE